MTSFRDKYDKRPRDHSRRDIFECIGDEAFDALLRPDNTIKDSATLALFVAGTLGLDQEDLPIIEQLVAPMFELVRNPAIVANRLKVKATRRRL